MQHRSLAELREIGSLADDPCPIAGRDARLARWAELLDRDPHRRLPTLHGLEFAPRSERPGLRADGSPVSVAFSDPVLRASGLPGDTYGDALAFFGLSGRQAHRLLCSCRNGPAAEGRRVAANLRRLMAREGRWAALLRRIRSGWAFPPRPLAIGG